MEKEYLKRNLLKNKRFLIIIHFKKVKSEVMIDMKNICIKFKVFCEKETKMKLLLLYLICNLIYILIGSYIFMTGKITENFHYLEFSRGLRNLLVLNMFVFSVICFEKKYKKNYLHFFIIPIIIFRSNFSILRFQ